MDISKQQDFKEEVNIWAIFSPKVYLCEYLSFLRYTDLVTPRLSNETENISFLAAKLLKELGKFLQTVSPFSYVTPGHR